MKTKNLILTLLMILPLTIFNSCNEDDSISSNLSNDIKEINFKSSSQQQFNANKETRYLLDFTSLATNNIVDFRFSDNLHKNNNQEEFKFRKNGDNVELLLNNEYLNDPINFYDIDGNLIHTISPYDNKSINQQRVWPWVVGAVVACCVEVSYSYSSESGHSFSAGFDCDCLSISF